LNELANDLVVSVIRALDGARIPHMLVGALASNVYGIDRSTKDVDFVIELAGRSIAPVAAALAPAVVIDPQVTFESVTLVSRYEGHHVTSGFVIEFFLQSDEPFHRERFDRRRPVPFRDVTAYVPTAEDVIVQKLRWFSRAKRSKDLDDARNVINVQAGHLDVEYIRRWCERHGTRALFEQLHEESRQFEHGGNET
jgi:hypothetical protein